MYREKFFEEGEVLYVVGTHAVVLLSEGGNCQECHARKYCKPGPMKGRELKVQGADGLHPGDKVRVEVYGSSLVAASLLIYGLPLVLLLAGVFMGAYFFNELAAGILGLAFPAGYAFILWLFAQRGIETPLIVPRIVGKQHQAVDVP